MVMGVPGGAAHGELVGWFQKRLMGPADDDAAASVGWKREGGSEGACGSGGCADCACAAAGGGGGAGCATGMPCTVAPPAPGYAGGYMPYG